MESMTIQYSSSYDPLYINEKPFNGGRLFLEIWFYFVVLASNFQSLTPLGSIRFGLGALIVLSGGLCFIPLLISRRSIPFSVWITLLLNIPVNLTQYYYGDTPIVGSVGAAYLQYACYLIMMCYLLENEGAAKRVVLFFGIIILFAITQGGYEINTEERIGLERGFGQSFRNADDLSHMAAFFAIASLFWSLKARPWFRPVYWVIALMLLAVILQTVARGGALAFICGLAMLILLIVSAKGQRLTGIVLIGFCFIGLLLFSAFFLRYLNLLSERSMLDTGRGNVYSFSTLREIMQHPILGAGSGTKLLGAGIQPHNTFIAMFFYYGIIAAIIYYTWIFILGIRVWRLFFGCELPNDVRFMLVTLFGMALLAQMLSNEAHLFFSSVYTTALLEKYLSLYSVREIQKRKQDNYTRELVRQSQYDYEKDAVGI